LYNILSWQSFFKGGGGMKDVMNLLLAILVLWVQSLLWGELIIIDSLKTLLFAGILLFIAELLVYIIAFFVLASQLMTGNFVGFFVTLLLAMIFVEYLALSLLDAWLPGLYFAGFLPKICTAFLLSLFRIPDLNANS
jgi:hypothetical protein